MSELTDYTKYKNAMKRKDNFSSKDFESLLKTEGYTFRSQEGSHRVFKNDKKGIMVSYPQGKIVAVGTLRKELKKIFPAWHDKPEETTEETTEELTPDMIALCEELGYNVTELTSEDYKTLAELLEA